MFYVICCTAYDKEWIIAHPVWEKLPEHKKAHFRYNPMPAEDLEHLRKTVDVRDIMSFIVIGRQGVTNLGYALSDLGYPEVGNASIHQNKEFALYFLASQSGRHGQVELPKEQEETSDYSDS